MAHESTRARCMTRLSPTQETQRHHNPTHRPLSPIHTTDETQTRHSRTDLSQDNNSSHDRKTSLPTDVWDRKQTQPTCYGEPCVHPSLCSGQPQAKHSSTIPHTNLAQTGGSSNRLGPPVIVRKILACVCMRHSISSQPSGPTSQSLPAENRAMRATCARGASGGGGHAPRNC